MGALFFPGILFMGLLFMTQGLSADIWQERSRGTLRRALTTPQRVTGFLGGKLLAAAVLLVAICLLGNVIGIGVFDLGWAHLPLAVAWSAFVGTVFFAVLLFLQSHASSERTASILATLVLFPLLMVGGSFFPFESMPAWLARIGRATPNGWALEQLKAILWGRAAVLPLARAFAALAAVGLVAFLLGARRLRRGFVGS
jgi:ABC-type multidrug transport system permease subunit